MPFLEFRARTRGARFGLPVQHRSLLIAGMLLSLTTCELLAAAGSIRAVQETLKKDQYLFEEPSGQLDDATQAALRRFQIRHGLVATGDIDRATLRALETPVGDSAPALDERSARFTVQEAMEAAMEQDKEFFRKLETSADQRLASTEEHSSSGLPAGSARTAGRIGDQNAATEEVWPRAIAVNASTSEGFGSESDTRAAGVSEDWRRVSTYKMGSARTALIDNAPWHEDIGYSMTPVLAQNAVSRQTIAVGPASSATILMPKTVDLDGRTSTSRTGSKTFVSSQYGATETEVRRAIAVEPSSKDMSYFHRLFRRED